MKFKRSTRTSFLGKETLSLLLILTVGLIVYSNAFHGPFQLDEEMYIRDNPFVRTGPSGLRIMAPGSELHKTIVQRYIGYLTFTVNYRLHGLRVEGYHVVNVAVHILNGMFVYLLMLLTFRTSGLAGSALSGHARSLALFSGLFFVAHPIQTEAVTYIMQRLASLAAFFSLLSLVLYIRWRLGRGGHGAVVGEPGQNSASGNGSLWWYAGSVFSAVLAMKTKENAFTLPIAVALYELFFFQGEIKKRIVQLLPIAATLLIIPLSTFVLLQEQGTQLARLAAGEGDAITMPWLTYLITQLRVMVTYYRLLLLPVDQNFLYDYPVYDSLFHPAIVLSLGYHISLVLAGIYLFRRSKHAEPALRIISFGIFWLYTTLFVESGFIPLPIMLCEYRMYLPSVGFFIAALTAVFIVLMKAGLRTGLQIGMIALSMLLFGTASAAYRRNALLSDNVGLWEDTVRKSPSSVKAHTNLGTYYIRGGRYREALVEFQTALRLDPEAKTARHNIIIAYIRQGRLVEAAEEFRKSLGPGVDAMQAHKHLGDLYMQEGYVQEGMAEYETVLRLNPDNVEVHFDLGNAFAQQNNYSDALREYQSVIRLNPDHIEAHNNLGGVYVHLGRYDEALRELQYVLERAPGHEDALYNLKVVTDMLNEQRARN